VVRAGEGGGVVGGDPRGGFCCFVFSIACANALLTVSVWSKVWSDTAATYCGSHATDEHLLCMGTFTAIQRNVFSYDARTASSRANVETYLVQL
jgi:hypothetical protein